MFSSLIQRDSVCHRGVWLGRRTAEPLVYGVVATKVQRAGGFSVRSIMNIGER
jgi:hypothetical protein